MTLRSFFERNLAQSARKVPPGNCTAPELWFYRMSYNKLRIAKIIQETPDARSFVLDIPGDLADIYRYRAV